ncbi:xylulokinase [Catalinimonas niigatensis]|uniref:xylulokinase n=1 Tax=Catalinimonas niigatensis TaxID=1397264 RepID=UPI0026655FA2|nr:FGGY family carbohydrate kinase [Catalinimonas niigatensis]WPP48387.1 FGGY family carbohydrate kinase [Catalinimonas niigatensis]
MIDSSEGYLLGYDLGSSSIKASLLSVNSGEVLASATSPDQEMAMEAPQDGWAEQDPEMWWEHLVKATQALKAKHGTALSQVKAIGISYQMHGLVLVDQNHQVLRPSIIWCDSRAVKIGREASQALGDKYSLGHLLNSPGNFTASKLKWVKENEPDIYKRIYKMMLPGDYAAMKLTGEICTTVSGLSEGIMWDFREQSLAGKLLEYYGINPDFIPTVVPTFADQGNLTKESADHLGLPAGIPVAYRAGDQPNNAWSLNVLEPGEVATTAGTSGVIYGVSDQLDYDPQSRVNTFAHVNYSKQDPRYGILACVNGTGIQNSWLKNNLVGGNSNIDYEAMNLLAAQAPIGSAGVTVLPFGNGAERTLANAEIDAHIHGIKFNNHSQSHILRAAQEGIVFALKYSFDILQGMGMQIRKVKAGRANMFLSPIFREAFANTTGAEVELYNTDGSVGAARGAGVGAGVYADFKEAFAGLKQVGEVVPEPEKQSQYQEAYERWHTLLQQHLASAKAL